MRDFDSHDEATAGYLAAGEGADYGDDTPTRAELAAQEHGYHPGAGAGSGNKLVDEVESALIWSAVMPGRWRVGVEQTAPGVVAFPLADTDPVGRITEVLTAAGFETIARDRLMYVRHARPAHGAA